MYSDDPLVLELLALLKAHGIKSVVISPGSRHYAITRSLENDDAFTLYSVADERSAAFFALGLIQATGAPAATLCTSGTASINYGSAVVEAFYQKLPLVVLTADRLPELLGQMEDQMFAQTRLFEGFVRSTALLKPVASDLDKWYVNRVLNEAFTALRAAGGGPVHVNIPILDHARGTFATRRLPQTRVISTHTPGDASLGWDQIAQRLLGRKVMVVWGQHAPLEASTYEAFNEFASTYGVVTLADHLSNLHHASRVLSPMTYLMSPSSRAEAMLPDIVITVGTNIAFPDVAKAVLRGSRAQHWRVNADGEVSDPFRILTDVFALSAEDFFRKAAEAGRQMGQPNSLQYRDHALAIARQTPVPPQDWGELFVIGALIEALPPRSVLHIANSAPMRMAQLFPVDPTIEVRANRGVNGIDGVMSTAIGYAAASDRLNFLVIGDISFFYDMNSLWIRHRSPNLRVLVINNEGGALMHSPLPADLGEQVGKHVSAAHETSVRGWVEAVQAQYLSASSPSEFETAVATLTDPDYQGVIVLEVFTEKVEDIQQMKSYYRSISGTKPRHPLRGLTRTILDQLGLLNFVVTIRRRLRHG